MSDRELLLRRLSAAQFAAWELKMFLDTHPNDARAMQSLRKYQTQTEALGAEFEEKYGPLTTDTDLTGSWDWIDNPWPWELKEDCD